MTTWQPQKKHAGIYRDADDRRHWRVVVNLGRAASGEKRRRAVRVLHGTLADARTVRAGLEQAKQNRQLRPQSAQAPRTVDEWFVRWLETYKRRSVERSTFASYENYHRLYISPHIGAITLRRLRAEDVQDFINALSDSGLQDGTSFQAVSLLGQALRKAVEVGLLQRDPMTGADSPQRPGRRRLRMPSDDELRALLDTMSAADASVYPMTRMALATGMREGELIALEWSSVDLAEGSVHVCRSAARVPAGPEGRRYYEHEFKRPKTDDSTRDVPLDPTTLAWLKSWKTAVREAKLELRPRRWTDEDGDLVFPCLSVFAGSLAGRAWQAGTVRKAFGRYTARVGLGYLRFHDLRHIYGAMLHRREVPLLTISRLMGHKSIKTTADIYGHVGDAQRREAVDTLTDVWGTR